MQRLTESKINWQENAVHHRIVNDLVSVGTGKYVTTINWKNENDVSVKANLENFIHGLYVFSQCDCSIQSVQTSDPAKVTLRNSAEVKSYSDIALDWVQPTSVPDEDKVIFTPDVFGRLQPSRVFQSFQYFNSPIFVRGAQEFPDTVLLPPTQLETSIPDLGIVLRVPRGGKGKSRVSKSSRYRSRR